LDSYLILGLSGQVVAIDLMFRENWSLMMLTALDVKVISQKRSDSLSIQDSDDCDG
jgi:hypothetical protein